MLCMGSIAFISGPAALAAAEGRAVDAYLGAYLFGGEEAERRAREKAIDDVVSSMNPLVRAIARHQLDEGTAIPPMVAIAADAKNLTITDFLPLTAPLDGSSVRVKTYGGNEMDLSYDVTSERLLQRLTGDGKGSKSFFTVEKGKLKHHVHIYAKELPKDLEYVLTYSTAPHSARR